MKKLILITALLLIGMVSMAQNYIGRTLNSVKVELDKKGIAYEGYVNTRGSYSISFTNDDETESRIYVFNFADKCDSYIIKFTDADMAFNYGRQFTNLGFTKVKKSEAGIMWELKKGNIKASCIYSEEDYEYSIIVYEIGSL